RVGVRQPPCHGGLWAVFIERAGEKAIRSRFRAAGVATLLPLGRNNYPRPDRLAAHRCVGHGLLPGSVASAAWPESGEGQTARSPRPASRTTATGPASAAAPGRPRPEIGRGPARAARRRQPRRPTSPSREAQTRLRGGACCSPPRTLPDSPRLVRTLVPSG